MKKINILLSSLFTLLFLTSCIDDIEIDAQEGPELIGINGYITNEYKKHQIVISKTSDFYSADDIEMISGAEVFVYDEFDTIYFRETENKGYYETIDSVAGIIGHTYHLNVDIFDENGQHNYYAQSTMKENIKQIDSLIIKELVLGGIPLGIMGLYSYFQSNEDPLTNYLINVAINDSLLNESLLNCSIYSLAGTSGLYVNGPEFIELFGELPLYTFYTQFDDGDVIDLYLYSVTPQFSEYISDINGNIGSNPMMGMPHNVSTNIYPKGKAVGFFEAASVVTSSIIY